MLPVLPTRVRLQGVTSGVKMVISRKKVASDRLAISTVPRYLIVMCSLPTTGTPDYNGVLVPMPSPPRCLLFGMAIPPVDVPDMLAFYLWADECGDYADDEADDGYDDGD